MTLAKDKVHEDGYQYKKGKSRSVKHTLQPEGSSAKRVRIDAVERKRQIDDTQDQIADLDKRIGFKNKRVEAAMQSKSFKTCDELSEEISELKSRCELSCELAMLQKKQKNYSKKKDKSKGLSDTDSSNPRSSLSQSTETVNIESSNDENSSDATLLCEASINDGRPIDQLVKIYDDFCKSRLSDYCTVSDGVYVPSFNTNLTLKEYEVAKQRDCSIHHYNCKECCTMLAVVEMVLQGGYVKLKTGFTTAYPGVTYNQQYAQ